MGFLSNIFGKKKKTKVGGMQDYMMLIRVYFQSAIASQVGITNIAMLPDLRLFKQTFKVHTERNKLGLAEKSACRKMLKDMYGHDDTFFKEIDKSIAKNCRKMQDVQTYLYQFQGFTQDLMMLMGNLMQWKMRLPGFLRGALREMVAKQVHEILTKNDWKDEGVRRTCVSIRKYQNTLGYSEAWMTEYVHTIVMLAKKEPKKNSEQ